MIKEIKPNKSAFLYYRIILSGIFLFFVSLIAGLFFGKLDIALVVFLLLYAMVILHYIFSFRKERYVFQNDRIIRFGGGIFSDYKTEVIVKNVTQVSLVLPFIENRFFHTGYVRIETSGATAAEEILRSIGTPHETYESIERLMGSNGFRISKKVLVQQEHPSLAGVILDTLSFFTSGLILFAVFADQAFIRLGSWITLIGALYIILLALYSILRFLDLRMRVYRVYRDVITFSEGFLTKHYSFIPVENLSDSTLSQGIIDRLLGIYDVVLSCQGSGKEIDFRHMANGKLLERNIDRLIAARKTTKKKSETKAIAQLKMDFAKTIAPAIIVGILLLIALFAGLAAIQRTGFGLILAGFFPAFIAVIFAATLLVTSLIRFFATTYQIKQKSVESRFDFLRVRNVEFTNDMVTAVTFRESIIDKIFGTMSIRFWSIGSASDLTFANIKKDAKIISNIKERLGFTEKKAVYETHSRFSMFGWLKSRVYLFSLIFFLLLASIMAVSFSKLFVIPLSLIIPSLLIAFPYSYYYYQRSVMAFYSNYLHLQLGLIIQEDYYAKYGNIKSITTEHYPLSDKGSITLSIAGEHIVQRGDYAQNVSNIATIKLVGNISDKDELVDALLMGKKGSIKPKTLIESKPVIANTLVYVASFLILLTVASFIAQYVLQFPPIYLLPLAFIIPFSIIAVIIWVKMISYQIDSYRVLSKYGVIYRSQKSVIFQRIAHINEYQGFLNKLFGNGTVAINTKGSSFAEMYAVNIADFKKFYAVLKKNYQ